MEKRVEESPVECCTHRFFVISEFVPDLISRFAGLKIRNELSLSRRIKFLVEIVKIVGAENDAFLPVPSHYGVRPSSRWYRGRR